MRRLGDLEPIHQPGTNPITEGRLRRMSDDELMRTVRDPADRQMMKARSGSNRVLDGNTRVRETQRRMTDPKSIFTPDTLIPVEEDF
jgi:hypothetical protein